MTVLYPYRCYNKLCCKRDSSVLVGIVNIEYSSFMRNLTVCLVLIAILSSNLKLDNLYYNIFFFQGYKIPCMIMDL